MAVVRNQAHDDREWQAIVERLHSEPEPPRREPLVMRILHRTSHAALFTIPALGTADHGARSGRADSRPSDRVGPRTSLYIVCKPRPEP